MALLKMQLKLIDFAKKYDFDAVKFQKRTIDLVFSPQKN
jgi:sialic acid synthase SpsE